MKLSIIIPVLNEENTVGLLLEKVLNQKLPKGTSKEVIVVDDGSTDGTLKVIEKFKDTIKLVKHQINLGKGAAVRSGLDAARGDIFIIQDADLEYDPVFYPKLIRPIIERKCHVIYGDRLTNYPLIFFGENKTLLPSHWLANKFLTWVTNILYGSNLSDMETGYKVFNSLVKKRLKLSANRFDIEPEITAQILKNGFKILEIPITVNPRSYQQGKKINWEDGIRAVLALIKYRFSD